MVFGPATGRLKRRDQLYAAFIAGSPGVELREAAEALDCHAEASRGHTFTEAAVIFSLVDASGKRPAVHFLRAIRDRIPDRQPQGIRYVQTGCVGQGVPVTGRFEIDHPAIPAFNEEIVRTRIAV
jgi:hypothetical protein